MIESTSVSGRWLRWGLVVVGILGGGCLPISDRASSGPASEVVASGFALPPRLRYGKSPTLVFLGKQFIGPGVGTHAYYYRPAEENGVVYTCRGGHIDTTHLRIAADWTAYLAARSYKHLVRGDPSFSFGMAADRSRHYVQISYPANWAGLSPSQRDRTAREVAVIMGPYLAYTMVTWYEIFTWYGYKSVGIVPEFHSAFSWEDTYSNLLGAILAARALRDTQRTYDQAMTVVLDRELRELGVQSAAVAKQASASVQGQWYSGSIGTFINMKKRGLDIGVDTGYVLPIRVPNVPGCAGAEPMAYPAPTLKAVSDYGFSVALEIEPHGWEKYKILHIVYPDQLGRRIRPDEHFAAIMFDIRQEAIARYGPEAAPSERAFAGPGPAAGQKFEIRNLKFETNPKFK
jgi:hypothetical protein